MNITIRIQFIKIKIINIVNLSKILINKILIISNVLFNSQLFCRLQNNRYFFKKNALNSISILNSNRKSKSNIEKLDKSNKIKVYLIELNDENTKFEKDFQKKHNDVKNYHFSKNLVYYESFSFNDLNENNNIVYFASSKIIFIFNIFCCKYEKIFSFNNKLY